VVAISGCRKLGNGRVCHQPLTLSRTLMQSLSVSPSKHCEKSTEILRIVGKQNPLLSSKHLAGAVVMRFLRSLAVAAKPSWPLRVLAGTFPISRQTRHW